jgi:hypothetical protein
VPAAASAEKVGPAKTSGRDTPGDAGVMPEMFAEGAQGHAIENPLFGHAALARHFHAPMREVDLARGMRIGIDAHHAAFRNRSAGIPLFYKHLYEEFRWPPANARSSSRIKATRAMCGATPKAISPKKQVNVGRSLAADRRSKSKTVIQGDRGDRRP